MSQIGGASQNNIFNNARQKFEKLVEDIDKEKLKFKVKSDSKNLVI